MNQKIMLFLIPLLIVLVAITYTIDDAVKDHPDKFMYYCNVLNYPGDITICVDKSCVKNLTQVQAKAMVSSYPDFAMSGCTSNSIQYDYFLLALMKKLLENLFFTTITYLPGALFLLSINKTMQLLPKQAKIKNCWLLLVTLFPVGIVSALDVANMLFKSVILVFVIPDALKKSMPENPAMCKESKTLSIWGGVFLGIGIHVILEELLDSRTGYFLAFQLIIGGFAIIPYWVKIVRIRQLLDRPVRSNNLTSCQQYHPLPPLIEPDHNHL